MSCQNKKERIKWVSRLIINVHVDYINYEITNRNKSVKNFRFKLLNMIVIKKTFIYIEIILQCCLLFIVSVILNVIMCQSLLPII